MKQHIPADAIHAFLNRVETHEINMHGFILLRHGETVCEGYWPPFSKEKMHRMYSAGKSITALGIGILQKQGKLSIYDRIVDYFPEYVTADTDPRIVRMTIRDMLRMASCHYATTYKKAEDSDWTRTFFTVAPSHEPGALFSYDTSATHTLSALIEKLAGMSLLEFMTRELFDKIGAMGEKSWLTDPVGVCQGGSGLMMTLPDLARVAQLVLEEGRGIVPAEFIREATGKQIDTVMQAQPEERYGYGYQFWRVRNGAFAMYGMGGQLAIIVPSEQLVFCTMADTRIDPAGVQKIHDAFWEEIMARLDEPETQKAADTIRERLASLKSVPVANAYNPWEDVHGKDFLFPENPMGLIKLRLEQNSLIIVNGKGAFTLPLALGSWAEGVFPNTDRPCRISAGWAEESLLHIVCRILGEDPCSVEILLSFTPGSVSVQMKRVPEPFTDGWEGFAAGYVRQEAVK